MLTLLYVYDYDTENEPVLHSKTKYPFAVDAHRDALGASIEHEWVYTDGPFGHMREYCDGVCSDETYDPQDED